MELRLSAVPAEYDLVAVAFAEATATPGEIRFVLDPGLSSSLGGYTDAQFGPTSTRCTPGASGSSCRSG